MAGDPDMEARERMAREYGEQAGIPAMYLDWLIGMAEPWDALPRLDATFDSQEGAAAVVVEILRGEVEPVLPPSSGSGGR